MHALWIVVGLVALQRLAEQRYAAHNTSRLLAAGAVEESPGHYPLIVALHTAWLVSLLLLVPPDTPVNWPLMSVFLALQAARVWVLATLGRYWTTRIITLPGAPLVRRGPYRFVRHPNYLIVAAEIAILPLVFGAWQIALVFSALNLLLLSHRIRRENMALETRRSNPA